MSTALGGPFLPANYAPRQGNHNPGDTQVATRTAGHSEPLETTVEPVAAAVVPVGNTFGKQIISAQVGAQQQLADYLDRLAPRKRSFSREGYDAQRRAFAGTESIRMATELSRKAADDLAKRHDDAVRQEIAALSKEGDAAAESRAIRIWNRTERELDTQKSGEAVATMIKLIGDATPEELSVYLQEVPSYMRAKGIEADWLDKLLEDKVPSVAEAMNKRALAMKFAAGVKNNADRLGQAAKEGRLPHVPLLDYSVPYDPDASNAGQTSR